MRNKTLKSNNNMSIKKWIYVAEILLEVCKTLLPFVKARTITIDRPEHSEDSGKDNYE